ncbi:BTAD domain-containing putative transcriptional regulator [Kineosporia mesophila]|nr:BTAD domain-containing putative transcriptional regulator [Kineosporia mesophila]MCD5349334.1 winged helix-turn-helix domain-containing protein [Kineosporia mesophila]
MRPSASADHQAGCRRSLRGPKTTTQPSTRTTVTDLIAQGRHALWTEGDLREARRRFEEAWTRADRENLPRERAESALGLGGIWVHEYREDVLRARILARQEWCAQQPGTPCGLALALRARVAAERDYLDGTHDRVLEALDQARRAGDPQLLATVLSLAHHCLLGPQHGALRTRLAEELLLTAGRSDRPGDALAGMLWLTVDQFLGGDPHAGRSLARLREALKQHDHQAFGYVAAAIEVMLAIRDGQLDRAEAMAAECAVLGERCGDADASGWYRGQLITIRWFQGRLGELLPVLRAEVDSYALGVQDDSLFSALAVSAVAAGDDLVAAGAVARLGGSGLSGSGLSAVPASSAWLVTVNGAAEAAFRLQDRELASTVYRLLASHQDLPICGSLAITCFGSAHQSLGLAALTVGDVPAGIDHLRRAVRGNLALGHWPAHCLSLHRLGHALLRYGNPQERAEAPGLLAAAAREADRFRMVLPAQPSPTSTPARNPRPATTSTDIAMSADIRIRLLGPAGIVVDGVAQVIPGRRRRTVLSVLALNAGELVGADRLVDIVWGDKVPRTAANTLQSHVSYLRRVLGPAARIISQGQGYVLDLPRTAVDAGLAEHLIRAQGDGPPTAAGVRPLTEALALWHGEPLGDVESHPWFEVQAQHLGQLRLRATKMLARAHLLTRQSARAVDLLTPAVREHPLDEQVYELLMLAYYRQGLAGRALTVFENVRTVLASELGADPSGPLRDLHTAILRQDPAL